MRGALEENSPTQTHPHWAGVLWSASKAGRKEHEGQGHPFPRTLQAYALKDKVTRLLAPSQGFPLWSPTLADLWFQGMFLSEVGVTQVRSAQR